MVSSGANGAPTLVSSNPGERIRYTPYGQPTLQARGDADHSGKADFDDQTTILATWNKPLGDAEYAASIDLDHSGLIDFADIGALLTAWGSMDAPGISAPTARHCSIAYTGALWDPIAQMSLMRKRWHDPNLGRFITRDPAGYVDGMSMYLYCRGNPLIYFDPWGLGAVADYFSDFAAGAGAVADYVGPRLDNVAAGAVAGAATGAGTGALVGSVVPGAGTFAGAMAGGVGGFIGGAISGLVADEGDSALESAKDGAIGGVIDGVTGGVGSKFLKAKQAAGAVDELAEGAARGADDALDAARAGEKRVQNHHFATNKHSKYTPDMEDIARRHGLSLDDAWNQAPLPGHSGRHTHAYHEWVLEQMRRIEREAGGESDKFKKLFEERVKHRVLNDPTMTQTKGTAGCP